jgi:general stress protein 26
MSNTDDNNPEAVWKIVKKVRIAMLVTRSNDEYEGRPLSAYAEPEHGRILFMTDSPHVISEVGAEKRVLLSFADPNGNDFAAIDGDASVQNDRAKIKELWTPWAEAFWDSPEDPAIRIIEVIPHRARYWDAPGKLATTIAMLASAVTGGPPKLGKSGDVEMR